MELKLDFDTRKLNAGFVDIEKANTEAVKKTLNTMAGLTRKNSIRNLKSDFVNRNQFTERSIQFRSATSSNISTMSSSAGALERASYMRLQEEGGTRKTRSGANLAIPTRDSRGGSNSSEVRRINYLKAVNKKRVRGAFSKGGTRKSRAIAMAYMAQKNNLFTTTKSGIYKITQFRKQGKRVKYKRQLVYNRKFRDTQVKPTPWLEPATKQPIKDAQNIYNSQVNKLLKGVVI